MKCDDIKDNWVFLSSLVYASIFIAFLHFPSFHLSLWFCFYWSLHFLSLVFSSSFLPFFLPSFLLPFLPPFLPSVLPSFLPHFLPSQLLSSSTCFEGGARVKSGLAGLVTDLWQMNAASQMTTIPNPKEKREREIKHDRKDKRNERSSYKVEHLLRPYVAIGSVLRVVLRFRLQ